MAADYQAMLDQIDALISAKLAATTSTDDLAPRNIGPFTVNALTPLTELLKVREYYATLLRTETLAEVPMLMYDSRDE